MNNIDNKPKFKLTDKILKKQRSNSIDNELLKSIS